MVLFQLRDSVCRYYFNTCDYLAFLAIAIRFRIASLLKGLRLLPILSAVAGRVFIIPFGILPPGNLPRALYLTESRLSLDCEIGNDDRAFLTFGISGPTRTLSPP